MEGLNPQGGGTRPRGPKSRWTIGQQPGGQFGLISGWFGGILGGESSNQTVSWSILDSFESYVLGIGSFVLVVALDSDVASVVAEVTTLAACLV